MDYHIKYIKYKNKYLKLRNQQGGRIPYVELEDKKQKYFPFDNNNFKIYNNDYSLIFNSEGKIYYLLNDKFELKPIEITESFSDEFEFENFKDKKNIINNNNIYKLADEIITISDEIKIPFHLCLLSKYTILDYLYKKHININSTITATENATATATADLTNIWQKIGTNQYIFNDEYSKNTFLKNNAQQVFKNIFLFNSEDNNEILNISYKYNILLKYSYCNKFLELLKLIYDIQSNIQSKIQSEIESEILSKLHITVDSLEPAKQKINILFKDNSTYNKYIFKDKYVLDDYIIINIINCFISSKSSLKNNFFQIYNFYYNNKKKKKKK